MMGQVMRSLAPERADLRSLPLSRPAPQRRIPMADRDSAIVGYRVGPSGWP